MDPHLELAKRLRQLRATQGLSLEALAERSGVSRSNISLIERGESSPSAVVLDRLATALGLTLAQLFAGSAGVTSSAPPSPLARADHQSVWTDPASGYRRRALSPEAARGLQLVAVEFPAGARVAYETADHTAAAEQQIWVMAGRIEVSAGSEQWVLEAGDCLAMRLDRPVVFHNPGSLAARYLVAIATPGGRSDKPRPAPATPARRRPAP